ncbi:elongation of very long chain fatty acids protein 6 [Folsomia candida]|uniref:Elongation of very long chain fatty acids protein n=1 Tax=Folsomia candida TaxID=158441 RepID=A0A226DDS8_FOLCA|nr:elongation of very long chain fatty acids protein 6 [Folsomia candida]OXA43745.1 Elongation of very long chain fatty acids protein 6 [Folsomia candida]
MVMSLPNLGWILDAGARLNLSEDVGLKGWHFEDPPKYIRQFEFECYDHDYWVDVCMQYWKLPFYVGAVYLLTIYVLQRYMRNKAPLNLKTPLFLWNLGLGLFSIVGFCRILPAHVDVLLRQEGFYKRICVREGVDRPTAFWYLAFGLSKYVELGDTIFLILRKKPVVLLQWYHHLVTLISQWLVGPLVEPISRWVVVMNYGVHSLMYPYFALTAVGVQIHKTIANFITTLQLSQMVFGLFINLYTLHLLNQGVSCARHALSIQIMAMVYGSFTLLFGKLFYDLVVAEKTKKPSSPDRQATIDDGRKMD